MKHIKIIAATYLFTLLSSCGNNENPQQPVKSKEAIRAELLNCVKVQEKEMHKSPELNNVTAG
ncbi:MAG: hypothetical protein ACXVPM_20685, partial [Bacteroidia bacterium]